MKTVKDGDGMSGASNKADRLVAIIEEEAAAKRQKMKEEAAARIKRLEEVQEKKLSAELHDIEKDLGRRKLLMERSMMAEAELYCKRVAAETAETFFQNVLHEAKEGLAAERENFSDRYASFVKRNVSNARNMLDKGGIAVIAKGDKGASLLSQAGFDVEEALPFDSIGGVIFHAEDRKRRVVATLSHIIDRDMSELRSLVLKHGGWMRREENMKRRDD